MRGVVLLAAIGLTLSGCATHWTRSYHRWAALEAGGPYQPWARCIDERSRAYLDPRGSEPAPGWFKPLRAGAHPRDHQMFTWVLADCVGHMRGEGWDYILSDKYERLIGDAYQHFFTVGAGYEADENAQSE
jgi:hypothetical protein